MNQLHHKYVEEILTVFDQIGVKRSLKKDHIQFLYWFMWINFKWATQESSDFPEEILKFLCDNGNDQSVDGFHFDTLNKVVNVIQSKYSADWTGPKKITYDELKRAADIKSYFSSGSTDSVVFRKANAACRRLLTDAHALIHEQNYELRIVFASNRLDPNEDNLKKVFELSVGLELEENFDIVSRYKIIQLWAEFLEGHNPPIPRYFIETVDERFLRLETPAKDLEALVAISTSKEIHKLHARYRERIFEKNVRSFLGNVQVNKEIAETLEKAPDLFFYRNSGLTILTKGVEPVPKKQGQAPGFYLKDLQIINGQQTAHRLSENPRESAHVLITMIGPHKGVNNDNDHIPKSKEQIFTSIIAARNFQSKIGYADLKANDAVQVRLWRELKDCGYFYERKKKAWKNLDRYGRALYRKAVDNKWAQITKEDLAAEIAATISDPVIAFQGPDFLFEEMYDEIFDKRNIGVAYVINLHLISSRFVYDFAEPGQSYAAYHVLRFLADTLRMRQRNLCSLRAALEEEQPNRHLVAATKILYKLCDRVMNLRQRESIKLLSYNTVFGKKSKLMEEMKAVFNSASFHKQRKRFQLSISKFVLSL